MLFAATTFVFSSMYFVLALLVVFVLIAAIGAGHAAANSYHEGIRKREIDGTLALYFDKANLPDIAGYFRAREHGDLVGAEHEKKRISKVLMNDKHVDRIGDHAAESWLRYRALDPEGRQKLIHDYQALSARDKGTEAGALEAAVLKILQGTKETATVPDGAGGSTTVPVGGIHVHMHAAPAAPVSASVAPPLTPAPPTAEAAKAA